MKTLITTISFSLFVGLSALVSEYSLTLFKHNQQQALSSHKVSFIYGWVEYQGNKRFFIQKNHYSPPIQKAGIISLFHGQDTQQPIIKEALEKVCKGCRLISIKQAGEYESLAAMNLAKKKLISNKKRVVVLSLPKLSNTAS